MYDARNHTVSDRIVSLSQPWLRPIVRGKAKASVEFGAKLDISVVNGWTRLEVHCAQHTVEDCEKQVKATVMLHTKPKRQYKGIECTDREKL